MTRRFTCQATGIGSVPFTGAAEACRVIFDRFPDVPFWPQLPRRTFLENMYVQYAEGLPGAVIDEAAKTIHIDAARAADGIEEAYTKYLENDLEYFAISPARSAGFYAFLDMLKGGAGKGAFAKGAITGPISFGLSVTDEKKVSIIYHKDLFEVLTKLLIMKAKWQIARIREFCPNVVIFIDEPYLISIGSSYVNINVQDTVVRLDETIAAIKEAGALAGVHCCGNTDWSLLLGRDLDILSFDAYAGAKEFALYADDIRRFTARGGTVAWGIIPSSDAIEQETPESLVKRFGEAVGHLEQKGIPRDSISSLVTPSCGLGSLGEGCARRIIDTARAVSDRLRGR